MANIGIVGAGLAGLAAGITAESLGHSVTIYEASDSPGGRVKSQIINGHIADDGFQIYLDGYPAGLDFLNLQKLDLKRFSPGAVVHNLGDTFTIGDPIRSPKTLPQSAFSKVGNIGDKLKLLKLRQNLSKLSVDDIWQQNDLSATEFLDSYSFSDRFMENFWIPLFSGVTLDPELQGSANTLQFVFKMLSSSHAVVPAKGMVQISNQLAKKVAGLSLIHISEPTRPY